MFVRKDELIKRLSQMVGNGWVVDSQLQFDSCCLTKHLNVFVYFERGSVSWPTAAVMSSLVFKDFEPVVRSWSRPADSSAATPPRQRGRAARMTAQPLMPSDHTVAAQRAGPGRAGPLWVRLFRVQTGLGLFLDSRLLVWVWCCYTEQMGFSRFICVYWRLLLLLMRHIQEKATFLVWNTELVQPWTWLYWPSLTADFREVFMASKI